jgi:hypothetical protein
MLSPVRKESLMIEKSVADAGSAAERELVAFRVIDEGADELIR